MNATGSSGTGSNNTGSDGPAPGEARPIDARPLPRTGPDWERADAVMATASSALGARGADARALLHAMASASPFLAGLIKGHAPYLTGIRDTAIRASIDAIIEELDGRAGGDASDADDVMDALRTARERVALLVALADCGGLWPLETVTLALSDFADACCRLAWQSAAGSAGRRRGVRVEAERGGFVLALGKHGARELNYSSDVDLVCFFDRDRAGGADTEGFVDVAKAFTRLLSARHGGRVAHRVDWRLRPDPSATPLAVPTAAALNYYQAQGRSWERLAYIKARPVAGDVEGANDFLDELEPFVWRRSLDFTLRDEMARMAERVARAHDRGNSGDGVRGWNVKTGRGGIREIEFLVQSRQTILGGRDPRLRAPATLDALPALERAGVLSGGQRRDLAEAYAFHRTLEHRLQMIDDAQTQVLPTDGVQWNRLATLTGEGSAALEARIGAHRARVVGAGEAGWAGDDLEGDRGTESAVRHDDPGGVATDAAPDAVAASAARDVLALLDSPDGGETAALRLGIAGLVAPEAGVARLSAWLAGRYPALRSAPAREALERVLPGLLGAVLASDDPDGALMRIDGLMARLPAGLQFLAMLDARPGLVALLVRLASRAPGLVDGLARDPALLASVTDAGVWTGPERGELAARIRGLERGTGGMEAAMDAVRIVNRTETFRLALRTIEDGARNDGDGRDDDPYRLGADMTLVTEACLERLWEAACEARGVTSGETGLVVVAMGRAGAREMTLASDLDLMIVSAEGHGDAGSPGTAERDARIVRGFVTAITSPTGEGRFRAVDMRLRPSGRAGPLVTTLPAFVSHHERAEAWELIALGRARPLLGPSAARRAVGDAIRAARLAPRDDAILLENALAVRERVRRDRPPLGPHDVKGRPGGLFEIEYAVQLARAVARPPALAGETRTPALIAGLREAAWPGRACGPALDELSATHRALSAILMRQAVTREVASSALGGAAFGSARPGAGDASPDGTLDALLARGLAASEDLVAAIVEKTGHGGT